MKRIHIIGIVVVAVMIGFIISTISDSSTYASFSQAMSHEGKTFHVVGTVNKQKPFIYNPEHNANLFGFYLVDTEGNEMKVLFNDAKPQDFEKSEQIVVIGKVVDNAFLVAKGDLLMKCPSKYNGNEAEKEKMLQSRL